ncbi:MAG: hypothetical protein LBR58_02005 [Propionibacteriaceae bacterium]|nr:hypothetical protein [Propionibacteriaceae bacterium]
MGSTTRTAAAALAALIAAGATWALFSATGTSGARAIKSGNLEFSHCGQTWAELSADADGISAGSPGDPADFLYQPGDSLDFDFCLRGTMKGDNLAGVLDIDWPATESGDTFTLYTSVAGQADEVLAAGTVGTDVRITETEDSRLAASWGDTERDIVWVLRIHRENEFDPADLAYEQTESPQVGGFTARLTQTRLPVTGFTGDETGVVAP